MKFVVNFHKSVVAYFTFYQIRNIVVFKCDHCSKSFSVEANLKRHMKAHFHVKTSYQCSECGKYLSRADKLEKHMESYHGPGSYAKLRTKSYSISRNEMPAQLPSVPKGKQRWKSFHCPLCEKYFSRKDHVQRHIKNIHKRPVIPCCFAFILFFYYLAHVKTLNSW